MVLLQQIKPPVYVALCLVVMQNIIKVTFARFMIVKRKQINQRLDIKLPCFDHRAMNHVISTAVFG